MLKEVVQINTNISHLTEKRLNSYGKVCKYHFRESDFETNARGQQGIKKSAVPILNLPSELSLADESNYVLVRSCKIYEILTYFCIRMCFELGH